MNLLLDSFPWYIELYFHEISVDYYTNFSSDFYYLTYICNKESVIMENNNSESEISLEVRNFNENMQRGDDFYKIELLYHPQGGFFSLLKDWDNQQAS